MPSASIQLDWTLNSDDEDGVRVYLSEDGGSTFTEVADLDPGTETHTEDDLLVGQEYVGEIEVYTDDTESRSPTSDPLLTNLPGVEGLSLDNGVVDEIGVSYDETINNGLYRVEYRRTNAETDDPPDDWEEGFTRNHDDSDATFGVIGGLLDGEEYEVRARTETDDFGPTEWVSETIITAFPAVVDFEAVPGETSVDLSWTVQSDNTLLKELRRERLVDGNYWPVEKVAELDGGVASYVDETVQPDTEYRYQIRSVTAYTFADSDPVDTTTDSLGVPRRRVPAEGWYVELDNPNSQTIRIRRVLDGATHNPQIRDVPSVEIPVRANDRYEGLVGTEMRVWFDGEQLAIDELRDVDDDGEGRMVLHGSGGRQLKRYSDAFEEAEIEATDAAADIIDQTDYEADIESVDPEEQDPIILLDGITGTDTGDNIQTPDPDEPLADPATGDFRLLQSGWFSHPRFLDTQSTVRLGSETAGYDGEWFDDRAEELTDVGDYIEIDVSNEYLIEAINARLQFRAAVVDDDSPELTFYIDGEEQEIRSAGLTSPTGEFDLSWFSFDGFDEDVEPPVTSVPFRIEVTESTGGSWYIDAVWAGDSRFPYNFNTVEDGEFVGEGQPEQYPDQAAYQTVDATSVFRILRGQFLVELDDTSGNQRLDVSPDSGQTWFGEPNTTEIDEELPDPPTQLRGRVTLSRYSDEANGDSGQELVGLLTLSAVTDDTPLLLDWDFRGDFVQALNDVADAGPFAWEIRRLRDESDGIDPEDPAGNVVTFALEGARTRTPAARVLDVQKTRTIEESYDRVVVFGASTPEETTVTAPAVGDGVGLGRTWIDKTSVIVRDSDTEERYERTVDYTIQVRTGLLFLTDDSDIEEGDSLDIEFEWRHRGAFPPDAEFGEDDWPRTLEERIPDATSDVECEQLALGVYRQVQLPLVEFRLTLSTDEPNASLVAALDHPDLPGDPGHRIVDDAQFEAGRVTLTGVSRRDSSTIFDAVKLGLRAVSDRV